jgi:hypothetical protein
MLSYLLPTEDNTNLASSNLLCQMLFAKMKKILWGCNRVPKVTTLIKTSQIALKAGLKITYIQLLVEPTGHKRSSSKPKKQF